VVNRGVPANAVSAIGYGGSKPIADNGTEAGRAANRRVTVRWGQR
jgi:OOP family OmpA-OmpF porin